MHTLVILSQVPVDKDTRGTPQQLVPVSIEGSLTPEKPHCQNGVLSPDISAVAPLINATKWSITTDEPGVIAEGRGRKS